MLKFKSAQRIRREQLDQSLSKVRSQSIIPPRPRKGWVREIREALGMKRPAFARRLSLDPSTVSRLEESEARKTITLASLERLARAIECDVAYVLIPRRTLFEMLKERAERLLAKEEATVEHSMQLEGQGTRGKNTARRAVDVAALIESSDKRLWEDD